MVKRLQQILAQLEHMPVDIQEEAAEQLEAFVAPFVPATPRSFVDSAGAWGDIPDTPENDEFAFFERIRHEVPPSPPFTDEDEK